METVPRQQLCAFMATYGRTLLDEPGRCEGLLRDVCGAYRREVAVLVSALKEGVAATLLTASEGVPKEVLFARLTQRLEEHLGLKMEVARWAVESWALALGKCSLAELAPPLKAHPEQGANSHPFSQASEAREPAASQQAPHSRARQATTVVKKRWFAKVESREDALKVVKDASTVFFMMAASQTALFIGGFNGLLDAVLYTGCGFFLRRSNSRVAAVILLILAVVATLVTCANNAGAELGGGKNIAVALIVFWAAVRAVEATFKLHGRYAAVSGVNQMSRA
jgi:hypothetical protein